MRFFVGLKSYRCKLSFLPAKLDDNVLKELEALFRNDLHLGSFKEGTTVQVGSAFTLLGHFASFLFCLLFDRMKIQTGA